MVVFKVQTVLRVLRTDALRAFWFLTLYDGKGYPIQNPINCNQLGTYDNPKADGSVAIYIQHERSWQGQGEQLVGRRRSTCPLLALSGHRYRRPACPLLDAKRTLG